MARGPTLNTNAGEESVYLWIGRPPSFVDSPRAIYSFTTDEALARHQKLYRGLRPTEALHDLRQRLGRRMAGHRMDKHRKVPR